MDDITTDMQKAVDNLHVALGRMAGTVVRMNIALVDDKLVLERLNGLLRMETMRRLEYEAKLGYRVPSWIWRVEELKRRTFGSGNGRVIRE